MVDPTSENSDTLSVGDLLKEAREKQGIDLEVAAKTLCISKYKLGNLEANCEGLTCDVYTLGFLKSYAQFLNLNVNALVQRFKDQANPSPSVQLTFPAPLPEKGMPSLRILSLSFFALVSVVIGYEWMCTRNTTSLQQDALLVTATEDAKFPSSQDLALSVSKESFVSGERDSSQKEARVDLQEIKDVSPHELSSSVSQESIKAADLSSSQPLNQPSFDKQPSQVFLVEQTSSESIPDVSLPSSPSTHLKAIEDTWVEVKDEKGAIVLSRLFYSGESYEFKNSQSLVLKTGNARGLHLVSGEKTLTFPGNQGEIKSGISLDPAKWKTN